MAREPFDYTEWRRDKFDDVSLLIIWVAAMGSGFLAVAYFTFDLEPMAVFSRIHAVSSRLGLVLVIIHIFQHMPQIKSYLGLKKSSHNNN